MLYAQPILQWQKNLGGTGNDSAYSVKPTTDGGYIVAGQSSSAGGDITGNHGGIDYWVAKLDATGNIMWQQSFGGSRTDIATSVQQTTDGGYIVAGISNSIDGDVTGHGISFTAQPCHCPEGYVYTYYPQFAVYESLIIKLDNTGAISWKSIIHRFHISGDFNENHQYYTNYANSIIQTSDGGYLIGGHGTLFANEIMDSDQGVLATKLTSTGEVSWSNIIFQGYFNAVSFVETSSGYTTAFYGSWGRFGYGGSDIFLVDINFAGENPRTLLGLYGGSNDDRVGSIQKTIDGGYILAGESNSPDLDLEGAGNHGDTDYWLLKLDSVGGKKWSKCFGGSGSDIARSVQQTTDGSYVVAGSSFSTDGQVTGHSPGPAVQSDYWIATVDGAGNFLNGKAYGGSANDDAYSIGTTSDNGFIVAGTSSSTDAGFVSKDSADYWLLKLSGCNVPLPGASDQEFCSSARPKVSDLVATGTNLKWYTAGTGGTPLAASTPLSTGIYYVSQTIQQGCESDRRAVSVMVNPTPGLPDAPFIQVFSSRESHKVYNLVAYGTNLKWYNNYWASIPLSPSTTLVTGFYFVSQTSDHGCESARRLVIVIISSRKFHFNRPSGNDAKEEQKTVMSTNVYPNPSSNGKVTVSINTSNIYDNAIIQIADLNGKVLMQEKAVNMKGHIQKTMDVSKLAPGVYIIRYTTGKESGSIKLVIAK
jgi:hypothetical protein